jgi:hypothetical protein
MMRDPCIVQDKGMHAYVLTWSWSNMACCRLCVRRRLLVGLLLFTDRCHAC